MEGEHAKILQIQANGTRKEKTTNLIKKNKPIYLHLFSLAFGASFGLEVAREVMRELRELHTSRHVLSRLTTRHCPCP